jgi:hypothetical protein
MSSEVELYIDVTIIAISVISGMVRYRRLDTSGRVVLILLTIIFFVEILAHIYAMKFRNNMQVYNVYSVIEFALMCLYFNYSVDVFQRRNIGYYLALIGIVFALVNYCLIQSINTFNSFYLFFEGFAIITMALVSFYRLLLYNEDLKLYRYYHFWFTAVFLFFWSITYLTWGLYPMVKDKSNQEKMYFFIWLANVISYGSIGIIFQLYPPKSPINE